MDVTLGSLLNESLDKLEALRIMPDSDTEEESPSSPKAVATSTPGPGPAAHEQGVSASIQQPGLPVRSSETGIGLHIMTDRGVPYFEEMIEHSRLGHIKRQVGGHTSRDGSSTFQWEVVETIIGGAEPGSSGGSSSNKRQRLDL